MNPKNLLLQAPRGGKVLDVGCLAFRVLKLAREAGRGDLQHHGVDYSDPSAVPEGFTYRRADLNKQPLPFPDDTFDLVVASHIIEHLDNPVGFFGECARVCRPGGRIYVACPSERSLWLPGFPFEHAKFYSLSFYDDPTHSRRPFSPQSLYRLACYWRCEVIKVGYEYQWRYRLLFPFVLPVALVLRIGWLLETITFLALGWASYAVVSKPQQLRGLPEFHYYIPEDRMDDWTARLARRLLKR
jgi:SAM-dependent methyltransferase